ncbi:MAG: elongation factor 3, partial [Sphingomonas bacterium]|nr:elongation factor 3 [Sphingomonas bacterium]
YGDRVIVDNFSTRVLRGDRVGIVGANGAGKTTLIKLMTGDLAPDSGKAKMGSNIELATLDQKRLSLHPGTTLKEALTGGGSDTIQVNGQPKHVIGYMKDLLFAPEQARTAVEKLSGGERGRLTLARALSLPSNVLVLDEPTNDLDLETLDLLQEVIADYDGTVLIVSHDRDFLDRTVTVTLGLDGSGDVDVVAGGYEDWVKRRKTRTAPKKASAPAPAAPPPPAAKVKLTYKDQRDYDTLPARIEQLDAAIARDEAAMHDPGLYARDPGAFDRLTRSIGAARAEKEAAELRWLELAEMVEGLG